MKKFKHTILPVYDAKGNCVAEMRSVNMADCENDELIMKLNRWRSKARESFFTQFEPELEKTRSWMIEQVVQRSDRVMFLISSNDNVVGYCGLVNICFESGAAELDGILRGHDADAKPNIMYWSEKALIKWCFEFLTIERLYAKIFAHNFPSISLFARLGLHKKAMEHMRRIDSGGVVRFERTDDPAGAKVCVMEIIRGDVVSI